MISYRLSCWIQEFKDAEDASGRSIFTRNTEKVALEQLKKVQYALDPADTMMYRKIPPGPGSTHGLPKWESVCPELSPEKAHEFIAHYANTGTSTGLADALTLGGIAAHNLKRRFHQYVANLRNEGGDVPVPQEFINIPPFQDHLYLHWLEAQAEALHHPKRFFFLSPIQEDNGELFLLKYFLKQEQQNKNNKTHPGTSLCICESCLKYFSNKPQHASQEKAQGSRTTNKTTTRKRPPSRTLLILQQPQAITAHTLNNPHTSLHQPHPHPPYPVPPGWLLTGEGFCFPTTPFFCSHRLKYLHRKNSGERILGRPPGCHPGCPRGQLKK